jgi:hypothetical protein
LSRKEQSVFSLISFHSEGMVCFDMIFFFCIYDSLETTRHVSLITIKLSKKELDTSSPGLVELYFFFLLLLCSKFIVEL